MSKRGHFSNAIKLQLLLRAGGTCSNPECRKGTIGPSTSDSTKSRIVGVAAHIKGAKGPRYDPSQTEKERHAIENGIWLCEQCASFIDKGEGAEFPVTRIESWKEWSEAATRENLEQASQNLQSRVLRTVIYVNVPRCSHFAALNNEPTLPNDFEGGVPSDRYIYDDLVAVRRILSRWDLKAFEWHFAARMLDDLSGTLVRFEGIFRTKNGPLNSFDRSERDLSDPYKAPHVYQKNNGIRLVLPYNLKFITTSTASQAFVSGSYRMGGFAYVKERRGNDFIASPLFIGHAPTAEAAAFMDAISRPLPRV